VARDAPGLAAITNRARHLRCRVCPVGVALVAVGVTSAAVAQDAPAGLRQRAGELVERPEWLEPASLESLLARAAAVDALPIGVSYLARFLGPLPGLRVGTTLLAQGIRIGTVHEVVVAFARGTTEVTASVVVTLDIIPDRVVLDGARPSSDDALRDAAAARVTGAVLRRDGHAKGSMVVDARWELLAGPDARLVATGRERIVERLPTRPPTRPGAWPRSSGRSASWLVG
jgi:hypothetical protein